MALTESKLIGYLQESLQIDALTLDSELFSNGALDSISMVGLIGFVEQSTGIQVSAADVTLENFDTPARILRFAEVNA